MHRQTIRAFQTGPDARRWGDLNGAPRRPEWERGWPCHICCALHSPAPGISEHAKLERSAPEGACDAEFKVNGLIADQGVAAAVIEHRCVGMFRSGSQITLELCCGPEMTMNGKCPKCDAVPNIIVVPLRARDEMSHTTVPVLQFLCDQCRTILAVTLDPEWQAQVVAGQLRTVGERSDTSH